MNGIATTGGGSRSDSLGSGERPVLVWFHRNLRLADNPALSWAAHTGRPIVPLYVLDEEAGDRSIGGASRWWFEGSLRALGGSLGALGSRLILRRGVAEEVIVAMARETDAAAIAWNRLYDRDAIERDAAVRSSCAAAGVVQRSFNASLLFEPREVSTGGDAPYRVFTPFWRRCLKQGFERPGGVVQALVAPTSWPASEALED